ncbi:MAG: M23 family metallopeptidase [Acidimicrobiaceae bacterium]|nr:M23 family metallopeptidase [Acidimicrobiaceae bacterium]
MARRLFVAVVLFSLGFSSLASATDIVSTAKDSNSRFTYVFPFSNVPVTYSRDHLNYPATDVSGCYAHVLAPTSGVVFDVTKKDLWDEKLDLDGTRGGLTITIHGDDNVRYYFAHLGRIKVKHGDVVAPGQWIGVMGSSGNARITKCHTHLGISRICPRDGTNVLQGEIWPWRFLDAWRKGINKSPVKAKNRVIKEDPTACEDSARQD